MAGGSPFGTTGNLQLAVATAYVNDVELTMLQPSSRKTAHEMTDNAISIYH